ncbi:hypothetical protein SapgrDRAFT_2234 [Saprospira grandis DSM 2844]|uniref:Uncharacterized protein n=1 Tax=Saprospira grandis DSM 2844 TaxID=694433 RepID=J1I571_9BACT|nr:hypothetical protein SapgrDRAFT_2234 [Saprospira grandis DSM 2844]
MKEPFFLGPPPPFGRRRYALGLAGLLGPAPPSAAGSGPRGHPAASLGRSGLRPVGGKAASLEPNGPSSPKGFLGESRRGVGGRGHISV